MFICTSTNTHVDYLKRSAQAGKAVYCEKPIGLDYQEAVDAVSVVRAAKVPVMLGFNRRFDPNHAALCRRSQARRCRQPGNYPDDITRAKPSGDQLSGHFGRATTRTRQSIFSTFCVGSPAMKPEKCIALGAAMVDPKVAEVGDVDTSIVTIRMASGALCQIDSVPARRLWLR